MSIKVRFFFTIVLSVTVVALSLKAVDYYPGSKLTYLLFCFSFWAMLLSAFYKRVSNGYLFLVVMLWLGFWGKLTSHLLLDYPYVEPVGQFDSSAAAWDDVLWVSVIGTLGVLLGRLGLLFFSKTQFDDVGLEQSSAPIWYPPVRRWIWAICLIFIVIVAVVNTFLGIQQVGLAPRTILLWPLNALIAWQVTIGSALLLTILIWWEVLLRKNVVIAIYASVIEASPLLAC